jgi:hypothetical protein
MSGLTSWHRRCSPLELVDQRDVHAADEADVAGFGLRGGGRADEEGACSSAKSRLAMLSPSAAASSTMANWVSGSSLATLRDRGGVGEADRDHRVETGAGQGAQALLLGRLGLAGASLGLLGLDAELLRGPVQAGGSGVVE